MLPLNPLTYRFWVTVYLLIEAIEAFSKIIIEQRPLKSGTTPPTFHFKISQFPNTVDPHPRPSNAMFR